MKKDTVMLHRSQLRALANLPSEDIKVILQAVEDFGIDGKEVEIPERLQFGWELFKMALELDNRRYQATCVSRSEAGKASAAKRKEDVSKDSVSTNSTNPTNVDFVDHVSTNPTHNHNHNHNHNQTHNHNQNTLTPAEVEYLSKNAAEITALYPQSKVGDPGKVRVVVSDVLLGEMRESNCSLPKAVEKVKQGVANYASAVKLWEEKRFITDAVKFFTERHYNFDPAVWQRKKKPSSPATGKVKFDPLDPETWPKTPAGGAA